MDLYRSVMLGGLLSIVVLGSPATGADQLIAAGDGIGTVRAFNPAKPSVIIGSQEIRLSAEAASSLQRQLSAYGWSGTKPFGAKFNVVGEGPGGLAIDSIYAYPPQKR